MIVSYTSTTELFKSLLEESFRDMKVKVRPEVEVYIVFMLDRLGTIEYTEEPLGPQLLTSIYPNRIEILRDVGDKSLFMTGFFEERLEKRGLSKSYYSNLCSSAYGELGTTFNEPYKTLSKSVIQLQRALKGVREACDAMGLDSWSVYQRWLKTKSPALERRMARAGMFIIPDGRA